MRLDTSVQSDDVKRRGARRHMTPSPTSGTTLFNLSTNVNRQRNLKAIFAQDIQ